MKRLLALGVLALVLLPVGVQSSAAQSPGCAATRAIFYSSSDWLRLAQGLAADPSACAQYYISIDPLTSGKTVERPNAASMVDALGPNFHAAAEINWTAWSSWVTQTGNTWLAAGQAARAAMTTAGFSVANGDTWAINEFPSTVRTNSGGARQDAEQFVQGLYEGNPGDPPAQGIVFMIGLGQTQTALTSYKASLESWFEDTTFWNTMSADVSDFMFESYGDVRAYAVSGESPLTRATYLNEFLQAPLDLASAANVPATAFIARQYLETSYGALANASWAWTDDYGWTSVPDTTMEDYIGAQTYAMRLINGGGRIGFAWNPLNTLGLDSTDFNGQVQAVLGELASSIHVTDGGDPTQACAATGCAAIVTGATPATGWSIFQSWSPTEAAFTNPPLTAHTGQAAGPYTLEMKTSGVAATLPFASALELSANTTAEAFGPGPNGPWSPELTLSLPAGSNTATFYTEDSTAGSPVITASLNGTLTTQTETVLAPTTTAPPAPPAALVTSVAFTPTKGRMHVALRVVGASGNPLRARVVLSLRVGDATVASTVADTTSAGWLGMTAQPQLERGCYRVR